MGAKNNLKLNRSLRERGHSSHSCEEVIRAENGVLFFALNIFLRDMACELWVDSMAGAAEVAFQPDLELVLNISVDLAFLVRTPLVYNAVNYILRRLDPGVPQRGESGRAVHARERLNRKCL